MNRFGNGLVIHRQNTGSQTERRDVFGQCHYRFPAQCESQFFITRFFFYIPVDFVSQSEVLFLAPVCSFARAA